MSILVTGATGTVGRHVVDGLIERGVPVRALARVPARARLPSAVEVVAGDVREPDTVAPALAGVDAVFLLWPSFDVTGAAELVRVLGRAPRIVHLSAEAAVHDPDSSWARLERLVESAGATWTVLRPTGFAKNTLGWADGVRAGEVRAPFGAAARSLIHEADIAEVAVRALLEPGHHGRRHVLSGPETITQIEQVRALADAVGHPVRWVESTPQEARAEMAETFGSNDFIDSALATWAGFVDRPEVVTDTVREITGVSARPFARWARDNAAAFR